MVTIYIIWQNWVITDGKVIMTSSDNISTKQGKEVPDPKDHRKPGGKKRKKEKKNLGNDDAG